MSAGILFVFSACAGTPNLSAESQPMDQAGNAETQVHGRCFTVYG